MEPISIVPKGFESTAHPIFFNYERPKIKKQELTEIRNFKEMISSLDTKCAICLSTFCDPVTICGCTHSFCKDCLERWLVVTENCPLCKLEILVFISAEPGSNNQQLFSNNAVTDNAIKSKGEIIGMREAVQMQAEIYSKLIEIKSDDEDDRPKVNKTNGIKVEKRILDRTENEVSKRIQTGLVNQSNNDSDDEHIKPKMLKAKKKYCGEKASSTQEVR